MIIAQIIKYKLPIICKASLRSAAICFQFIMFSIYGFSQTYPTQVNNSECYGSYTPVSNTIPEYLQWFDADLSNSRIMRITDRDILGVTGQRLRHNYSKDQTWNSDETLIKMSGYPAAILDAETYEFLFWSNIPSYGRWSNTQPNIIYGTSGNSFVSHNVYTNERTILRTFPEYDNVDFGFGEGNQDKFDRYVGLIGRLNGNRTLIVYDIQNDIVTGTKELGTNGDLDWFSVSQLGGYAVAQFHTNGSGEYEGVKSWDINMQNETHVYHITQHADLGVDAQGYECIVSYGNEPEWDNNHSLYMARLDGLLYTPLFSYINGKGIWGGHISCRNFDRPGWAYISENCCPDNPLAAAEIFAIKLDNSGIVERYAKHHSYPENYLHTPKAVPNRNGTKIIFASNWFDEIDEQSASAFVLEVNQSTLSLEPMPQFEKVEYPYQLKYYTLSGKVIMDLRIENERDFDFAMQNFKWYSKAVYIEEKKYKNRVESKKVMR